LFDVFKLNTISNFTTENVIFEFHIQEIYEQVSATLQMGSVPSDTPVPDNLKAKYGEIFRLYICSDSPLVVSILFCVSNSSRLMSLNSSIFHEKWSSILPKK
jgi:hypothetical protein